MSWADGNIGSQASFLLAPGITSITKHSFNVSERGDSIFSTEPPETIRP